MLEISGYIASILIGISLGLFGAGGTILTLPILVFLFEVNPFLATSYSLFIVAVTSLAGSISYHKNNLVDFKIGFTFALPSIISVLITRRFILPVIPEVPFTLESISFTRDMLILLFFSLLMIGAAYSIIKKNAGTQKIEINSGKNIKIILNGLFVGVVTGSVGAGGGFLIIPALVVIIGLPIKKAIGTSLLIITINSVTGFIIDFTGTQVIDYFLILKISFFAMSGTILGRMISNKIPADKLKPVFGFFILTIALYIIFKETAIIFN